MRPTGPVRAALLAASLAAPAAAAVLQSAARATPPQRPFAEASSRGNARIFYWGGDRSAGQLSIDYGQPAWKPEFDAALEKRKGVRWRLGQNAWTSLDTNIDLRAGAVEILAGHYYLVLERGAADGAFTLWLLDPVEIRDARLDAFQADRTSGGIAVPMTLRKAAASSGRLVIRLDLDPARKDGARLVVHFGPHELTADLTLLPSTA